MGCRYYWPGQNGIKPFLGPEDIIIDGGTSYYRDSIRRPQLQLIAIFICMAGFIDYFA